MKAMARNHAASENGQAKVLVVDAMEIRRSGIVSLLSSWAEVENLHLEPVDVDAALKALDNDGSSRLIIFNTGGDSILERETEMLLQRLHDAGVDIPLVVISDKKDLDEIAAAVRAGAMGYLHSGSALDLARQALSFIVRGGSYFPICFLRDMQVRAGGRPGPVEGGRSTGFESLPERPARSIADDGERSMIECRHEKTWTLTPRQSAVMECLRQGDSNKLIARRLSVSETTVKVHVRQIMRKLGAINRTQAVVLCNGSPAAA
jgi:DNA-binding NarL/FixJ family response regulator